MQKGLTLGKDKIAREPTRCLTCENKEKFKIENAESTEKEKREQMANTKQYKYIRETSRTTYIYE